MQALERENVQNCAELLEDFCDAVPMEEGSRELLEKKAQAEYAINHLTRLFDDVNADEKFDVNDACGRLARNCKRFNGFFESLHKPGKVETLFWINPKGRGVDVGELSR